jgi:hypothetical protein
MVCFDVNSDVVEVHSADDEEDFFYVHEDLLRQQFGNYGAMIDEAVKNTGTYSIQLNLSHQALEQWVKWLYGEEFEGNYDCAYFKPFLELYEYSHTEFHPEVDHRCANACLDGIRAMLDREFEGCYEVDIFGYKNLPTFTEVVTKLEKPGGRGVQMLVDMMVHGYGHYWTADAVDKTINDIEPVACLAPFFQKLSSALAISFLNATQEDGPESAISTPNYMSPHAYHTKRERDTQCCP